MKNLRFNQIVVIVLFGVVGWALCGAIMFIGMEVTSMQATLIAHAMGAPLIFATISWIYYTRFGYTKSFATAMIFLAIVVFLDFFPVATMINRSFEMFTSLLGTWTPWALIFLLTYLTGRAVEAQVASKQRAQQGA
jgi:hypothetical protein